MAAAVTTADVTRIAQAFKKAILDSANSPEDKRPAKTNTAVQWVTATLTALDTEIGDDKALASDLRRVFRAELDDLRLRGLLWSHALAKPRGYPGDYRMLQWIYDCRLIADDPVGRECDRGFLESPLAETVRQRKNLLVSTIRCRMCNATAPVFRILDLACGPCADVVEYLSDLPPLSLNIVCIDLDQEAIDFAKSMVPELNGRYSVEYVKANVFKVRPCSNPQTQAPFDIVYSVGLLDYVHDSLAAATIRGWWKLVAPGGCLLLTIKDRARYEPSFYDWAADWTFVPRTEEQFTELLAAAIDLTGSKVDLLREKTGVSVMAVLHKPS